MGYHRRKTRRKYSVEQIAEYKTKREFNQKTKKRVAMLSDLDKDLEAGRRKAMTDERFYPKARHKHKSISNFHK